jgi:hypothetical protein
VVGAIITLGTETYPAPEEVSTTLVTIPPFVMAKAVAPEPPPFCIPDTYNNCADPFVWVPFVCVGPDVAWVVPDVETI